MRISAIQGYKISTPNTKKRVSCKENSPLPIVQPSFKGSKGAKWGGILGAIYGISVIVATGGIGAVGIGLTALAAGCSGIAGATLGDQIEGDDDDKKDVGENK